MSLLNLCPRKAKAVLSHAAHGPSEGFGWRISLSSSHHVVDQSDQWLVLWLRSLDNLSTELCTLSRSYRKSTAASGHQEQIKEDQRAATSRSQNLLPISFVTQERHAETFQPSNVAIKSVSGRHEDELPAASQHRAVNMRLLTPQKHLSTPLNSSDCSGSSLLSLLYWLIACLQATTLLWRWFWNANVRVTWIRIWQRWNFIRGSCNDTWKLSFCLCQLIGTVWGGTVTPRG